MFNILYTIIAAALKGQGNDLLALYATTLARLCESSKSVKLYTTCMQKVLGSDRRKYILKVRPTFPCGLQDNSGSVEFKEIYAHSSKYGGMALSPEELKAVFQDFDTSGDSMVSADEFLTFFSRTLTHCSNKEFDEMMKEMLD
jgi:hypothetical protein